MKKINLSQLLMSWNEKQTPQRFARYAVMLIMLLTLGVGQMWADNGDFYNMYLSYTFEGAAGAVDGSDNNTGVSVNAGTLTSGSLILTGVYLKCWDDWGNNYKSEGGQLCYTNKGGSTQYVTGLTRSGKSGNNYEYQKSNVGLTIASYNQASGSYSFESWGQTWGSNWGDRYFPKSSGHYTINYKIAPPAVSDFTITPSGDGYVSGSGTSGDPYIMKHDAGNLVLTISGSKAHTDANSSAKYYTGSSWGNSAKKTIYYASGSTTKQSVTLKMKYNNSTASLDGAESSITVYYQRETAYTVSKYSGGSVTGGSFTATSPAGAVSGSTVTATPSTGYNFSGWSVTSGSGTWKSSTSTASNTFYPTSNSTLKASFTAKTTTVTLNANAPAGQTVTGGGTTVTATYNKTLPSFSALSCTGGYALKGYYDATSDGNKIINADGSFNGNSGYWNRTDGASLALYAQWSLDRTLTYDGNGSTGGSVPASPTNYSNGATATVLGNTNSLVKAGYTFNNWNTSPDGGGTPYSAGNSITMNANYTLFAQWTENDYTVTVNAGSNGSVASGSVTGHKDTKVTLPTATANTGYHFSTWTTTTGSVTYTNQTSASEAQVNGLTAAATVRADFAANTYNVVFNKNGGSGTMSNQSFTYNEAAKALTSNSFTRSGYTFLGWATSSSRADALTVDYTNGQSVRNLTSENGGTYNLYAVWAKDYYIGGRFQHDWEDGNATTNKMTYDASSGYYKFATNKTVSELSVQWHNVSGDYYADQYFYIHTGKGKGATSSQPTYVGASSNGHSMQVKIGYANAYVLTSKTSSFSEFTDAMLLKFSNVDNLSSSVIVWWDPANKKIWYTATESLNTNYYLLGFGSSSWGEADARRFKVASVNATTATVTVSLTAKTYTGTNDGFKLEKGGAWYGNSGTMTRANCTGWVFSTGESSNCSITADLEGTYTFTLNLSTQAISVTYPTAYTVTFSAHTISGSNGQSGDPTATYNSGATSVTSGDYVPNGTNVTFTAAAAKPGYTWNGWYTAATSGTKKSAGTDLSYSETVNGSAITRYARYTQNTHSVTLTNANSSQGTVNTSSPVTVGEAEAVQIQATANTGYMFAGWVKSGTGTVTYHVGSGADQVEDAGGASKATTYITVTGGDATLQATWDEDRSSGYFVHYGNDGKNADGGTDATQTRTWLDGNLYKRAGETAGTVSYWTFTAGTADVTKVIEFKVLAGDPADIQHATWYGYNAIGGGKITGSISNQTLNTDYGNGRMVVVTPGDYVFKWDSSTKKLSITYPAGNYVRGEFDSWGWTHAMSGSGPWTATINLPADQLYETASEGTTGFKYVINGQHYGKNGTISSSSNSLSSCTTDGQNMGLATTIGGNYTFTVAAGKTQVTVTYPTIPAMTGTVGLSVSGARYTTTLLGTTTYHVFAGENLTLEPTHSSKPANDSHFKYTYYNGAKNADAATTEITTIVSTAASLSYNFNVGSETGTYPLKVGAYYEYGPDGYKAKGSAQESSIAKYHVHLSPAVTLTSDKVSITDGQSVTLTATPSHVDLVSSLNKIKYEFFNGNSTEEGDKIGETISKSDSDAVTKTVTPDCSGDANSWKYTVKITYLGVTRTSVITVYRKWDIYVDDVCSWGEMKLYMWDEHEATPAAFPGTALSNITGSTHWYVATLDTRYPNFKFDKQSGTESSNHTADHATYAPGTHWYLENCSTLHPVTISNPTVTISATVTNATQINLTGFVSNFGGDGSTASGLKEVYFNVNGTKDATGITASTTDGNFTKALSNPTPDNTNNTLQAAATNIVGTGTSSSLRFTKITLDKQSGSSGTTNVQAVNGVAMASGATAPTRTGYTFGGYFASTGGSGKQYYNANMTSANNWDQTDATKTLYAKWTANPYTITLNDEGATTAASISSIAVTFDANTNLTETVVATIPAKTGYTFGGYYTGTNGTGVQIIAANGQVVASASGGGNTYTDASKNWKYANNLEIHAKWTAKTYTVNLTRTGTGYDSGGTASVTATYGAAMPDMTSPTAANGYAFMGYFTAEGGEGTQYYNANGSSAKNWDIDVDPSTLYAYYKKAEITDLTFSPSTIVATGVTVTVTPTIAPTPTGNIHVEWCILYDNGNPLPSQPTITHLANNAISFTSMSESGTYKVEANLRLGTTEGAGTIWHTFTKNFQVAGKHDVTVRYVCGDYPIQASSSVKGKPLEWTSVTAPTITGYTFTRWVAGDGITIEGASDNPNTSTLTTINFKAIYDGTLKAEYSKKKMIFFNNTLGWEHVYVFFYNSNEYWNNTLNTSGSPFGSGAKQDEAFTDGHKPYFEGEHGEMTQIEGTNIWYFDYTAENYPDRTNITFAKDNQHTYQYFDDTEVARICDAPFNGEILPMYVPIPGVTEEYNKHDGKKAVYYTKGYWMNYPENTGYWLKVFNKKASSDAPDAGSEPVTVKDIPFTFPADFAMPMSVKVDLEAGKTYGFKIYRIDNTWYGNSGTMKDGDSGAEGSTPWEMTSGQSSNCGILTTSAGDYTFTLRYAANSGGDNFQYRVSVDYPVAVGDYRIVYKDNARWSQGTAHSAAWSHPSAVITKNSGSEAKADTVSFFVSVGSSPSMKFQKVKSITAATGEVTWEDVSGGSITIPSHVIDSGKGVYNFIVSQPVGGASISLTKAEEYTGNFYIRTDCAGTTKWDNYKADDHLMTYSDYAANNEGFTHYFAHWVRRSENVKFVIANDYSPCVSDTLIRDNDYIYNNMDDAGTLYSDGNPDPTYDKYSANIRFMYNQAENKISRAYVSGSSNEGKFIIMQGASKAPKIYDKDGNELPATDKLPANAINLTDDQNFIYETNIKANAEAYIKLKAQYCDATQYFKGDDDDTFDDEHAVEILGGTFTSADNKEKMRVIYDFKTNRLVCAWQPSDSEISGELDINADVMIIREHQGEADQITFKGEGSKLDEVKTVYGVMRFNRWTLANKEKTGSHSPLGDPKSNAERQIYFISFPFDVNLSDIFGLGAYDDLWWIEYYDGAERASKGYFQETKTFWKFMENTKTAKLEANKGYLLKLDAEMLKSDNERVWTNNIEQVELFFPSATEMSDIEQTTAEIELAEHPCSININPAGSTPGDGIYKPEKDRRKRDSNWNCMGVPSYANYSSTLKDKDGNDIRWSTWEVSDGPTFLYTWNPTGNSLSPTASAAYTFKTMWSYLVQASGTIKWNLASATPKSVAARRNANYKSSYMFRLELQQDGKKVEHTYVNLRDNEKVTTDFDDNFDLSNEGGAIYTTTHDLVPVAGNCLPLELEQETRVPVGVTAKTAGEYTFAMPDGTEGLSVTLVDNESGAHTNLALGDYTVELTAGTHEGRFMLVIDPRTTTTSIDVVGGEAIDEAPRKIFINGLMYIQRAGNLYDAQGRKVN